MHPSTRLSIAALAAAAVVLLAAFAEPPAQTVRSSTTTGPRPNVLLLVADDLRWDAIGAAGNPVVVTPYLNRLAAEGVRFANAFVTTSEGVVSRASLLTGQHMARHGIAAASQPLGEDAWTSTYPAVLRQAGYWTGFVGTYGVGPARRGDFDFLRTDEGHYWMTTMDGETIHVTQKNARDGLEFLRSRPTSRPFALTVSFFAPRAEDAAPDQYLPQEWSAAEYAGVTMPPPLRGRAEYFDALPWFLEQPANEGRIRYVRQFDAPDRYQESLTRYYRLVTEVDLSIGRLLEELEAQSVADDTLVVFVGANGYFQADRGLAGKWYPYEESIRIPLIVRDPRLPRDSRGLVIDQMALNIDVGPSLIAAASSRPPDGMQGLDLSRLYLGDPPDDWRDEFFYEHSTIGSRERIPSSKAVVGRKWKYVLWPDFEYEQLFDLGTDPGELVNLAFDPAYAGTLEDFRSRLVAWEVRVR